MQTTIKFPDGKSYNTSEAKIGRGTLKGHSRETLTIKAAMSYAEAAAHFVDGAVFTLTDEFGDSYEWRDHGVAGAITDNRERTARSLRASGGETQRYRRAYRAFPVRYMEPLPLCGAGRAQVLRAE